MVFEPFGLSNVQSNSKPYILAGYGLVTFLILLVDLILLKQLFPSFFKEENWTIWKQLLFLWWIIFSIGLGNSTYTSLFFNFQVPAWQLILNFQLITLTIGFIPILVTTVVSQNHHLKKNLEEAQRLNSGSDRQQTTSNKTIRIVAENGKDQFSGQLSDLLFIVSEGNYILIHHLHNDKLKKTILRNTLTKTEEQVSGASTLIKTHRAYLVNLEKIKQVGGNAQSLRLQFNETEMEVPVSRTYLSDFKQAWEKQ